MKRTDSPYFAVDDPKIGELGTKVPKSSNKIYNPPKGIEEKQYLTTETEFNARNKIIIIKRKVSDVIASHTLYEIPERFTLFLTGVWISSPGNASIVISQYNMELIETFVTGNNSLSFPMPLKIDSGTINFNLSIAQNSSAGIIGWLEPSRI